MGGMEGGGVRGGASFAAAPVGNGSVTSGRSGSGDKLAIKSKIHTNSYAIFLDNVGN
jgi:hypothetical protein